MECLELYTNIRKVYSFIMMAKVPLIINSFEVMPRQREREEMSSKAFLKSVFVLTIISQTLGHKIHFYLVKADNVFFLLFVPREC